MTIEQELEKLAEYIITTEHPGIYYQKCNIIFNQAEITACELQIGVGTRIEGMYFSKRKQIVFRYHFKPLNFFHELAHHYQYLREPLLQQKIDLSSMIRVFDIKARLEKEADELSLNWNKKYKELLYKIPNIEDHLH